MQAKVYSVARPPIQSTAHDRVAWQAHGVAVVRIGIAVLMNGARKPRNYRYHGVLPGGARPCGQWIQPVGELTLTRTLIGVYVPAAKRPQHAFAHRDDATSEHILETTRSGQGAGS